MPKSMLHLLHFTMRAQKPLEPDAPCVRVHLDLIVGITEQGALTALLGLPALTSENHQGQDPCHRSS